MKLLILAFAVALADSTAAASPAQTKGGEALARLSGTWTSSGTLVETPYSKAGSATATTTCAWSEDRFFMICQQRASINGVVDRALSVYSYDASTHEYHFYHVGSSGGSGSTIAVDDSSITYSDSFTEKGRSTTIRTLNVWESENLYRWRTEYSNDAGSTWVLMASGTSQK